MKPVEYNFQTYSKDTVLINKISRMSALARKMIDYFNGDVDVLGHYCGLEFMNERSTPNNRSRTNLRTWEREHFAVEPSSPEDWEGPFSASISRIDFILKERYDNQLPTGIVHEFYDHIETSVWESKQSHDLEELSVGLEVKCVFREHYHLPSIVIEAQSVTRNRKACEAACETLSQEAAKLFSVRFKHLSLSAEKLVESADRSAQS